MESMKGVWAEGSGRQGYGNRTSMGYACGGNANCRCLSGRAITGNVKARVVVQSLGSPNKAYQEAKLGI